MTLLEMRLFLPLLTDIKTKPLDLLTRKFDMTCVYNRGFQLGLNFPEIMRKSGVMSQKDLYSTHFGWAYYNNPDFFKL